MWPFNRNANSTNEHAAGAIVAHPRLPQLQEAYQQVDDNFDKAPYNSLEEAYYLGASMALGWASGRAGYDLDDIVTFDEDTIIPVSSNILRVSEYPGDKPETKGRSGRPPLHDYDAIAGALLLYGGTVTFPNNFGPETDGVSAITRALKARGVCSAATLVGDAWYVTRV